MRECNRCLLPEGKFSVVLNDQGLCNYCTFYEKRAPLFDYARLKPFFTSRLDKVRGKYPYDALVGISGGKDSTYILQKMVVDYGLKVLAITYENGFLTDIGKRNIDRTVKKLGVDHFYHYPNWDVHKKLYEACVKKLGDPCLACAFAGFFLALKICSEKRIPFFINGRSPSQIFRNFFEGSKDMFIPMTMLNMEEHSFAKVAAVYGKLNEGIRAWVSGLMGNAADVKALFDEFYPESSALTPDFAPEIISYFIYEPYNEEEIKRKLQETLGYERKKNDALLSHLDCRIVDVAGHMYQEIHGVSMLAQEVAVMLRRGDLTQEQARKILAERPAGPELDSSICALCERIGIDQKTFPGILEALKTFKPEKFASR